MRDGELNRLSLRRRDRRKSRKRVLSKRKKNSWRSAGVRSSYEQLKLCGRPRPTRQPKLLEKSKNEK